jgi:PAS domain S-box-containing protein
MTDLDVVTLAFQLIARSRDAIVIADPAGTIAYWNEGAVEMFGYQPSQALGSSLDLIIPGRFRQRHWLCYTETMRTGQTSFADRVLAVPAIHRDGRRLSIQFRVTLLGLDPTHPAAIGAIIQDVTQRWERDRRNDAQLARHDGSIAHDRG